MLITFKQYCILMLHVFISILIVLSLPAFVFAILYNIVHDIVIIAACVAAAFPSIFATMRYVNYTVDRMVKWEEKMKNEKTT